MDDDGRAPGLRGATSWRLNRMILRCIDRDDGVLLDVGAQPRFDTPALVARGLGILAYFAVNTAALLLGLMRPLRPG